MLNGLDPLTDLTGSTELVKCADDRRPASATIHRRPGPARVPC